MTSIAEGGCIPPQIPHWPRPPICWPPYPPPPEPDPDSLDAEVDWMSWSHLELWNMVHQGLDTTGAMEVSATWARLGNELAEIGDELAELLDTTAAAWQGEAAELTRTSISALANWSQDTGADATQVSGCVTIEVDNATNARNKMPSPLVAEPPRMPQPWPDYPEIRPMMPAAEPFTGGDFASANAIVADQQPQQSMLNHRHFQAAQTMRQFQNESRDVYETVPRFSPPDLTKMPRDREPQPQPTTPAQNPGGGAGGGGAAVAGGGAAGTTADPGARTGGAPAQPGVMTGSGAAASGAAAQSSGGGAAAAGRSAAGAPVGGMPMGGMGAARGGEEAARKGSTYLEEDDDIWGMRDRERPTPPVIGEDRRRA